jgi:hypothetical protein
MTPWRVRRPRELEMSSELNGGANVDKRCLITLVCLIPIMADETVRKTLGIDIKPADVRLQPRAEDGYE